MLVYPARETAVLVSSETPATETNTVSDERTFYDSSASLGALSGDGDATTVDAVDSYGSAGSPSYVRRTSAAVDAYGRLTSSTDADGNTTATTYSARGASPDTVTVTN